MNAETLGSVSNLVIPTATVVYALAMIAHAVEWAGSRTVAKAEVPEAVLVGCRLGSRQAGHHRRQQDLTWSRNCRPGPRRRAGSAYC